MSSNQYLDCESCACFLTRRMTRHLTQFFDQRLKPTGLRSTQFSALVALIRIAVPVPLTRLASVLGTDRTTLTRSLEHLENNGFVVIDSGDDKRTRLIEITPTGRKVIAEAYPIWKKAQAEIERYLSIDHLKELAHKVNDIE